MVLSAVGELRILGAGEAGGVGVGFAKRGVVRGLEDIEGAIRKGTYL